MTETALSPGKGYEGQQLLKNQNDLDDLEDIQIKIGGREPEPTSQANQEISGNMSEMNQDPQQSQ